MSEQTITLPGTTTAELVTPTIAAQIKELKQQQNIVASKTDKLANGFPLSTVLTSKPGAGAKTTAQILLTTGNISASPPQDT
ncbi:hypothetical protein [Actinomyces trachealis]|uniref:hypothetical protein n=1 Tax=Actinomyces trachealis TaxID=2763540 RepID=UPI001892AC04|nr:hypothetical protein [Actinomyces trachealis]